MKAPKVPTPLPAPAPDATVQLQIRMSGEIHDRLRRVAYAQNRSLSNMAAILIDNGARFVLSNKAPARKLKRPRKPVRKVVMEVRP